MASPEFQALRQRLRELTTQGAGIVDPIPVGRFAEGMPDHMPAAALDRITQPGVGQANGQPRIEIGAIQLGTRSHQPRGNKQIRKILVVLTVVRALPSGWVKDDNKRAAEKTLAEEDGAVLAAAIEPPENLELTEAGAPTGCRSLELISSIPVPVPTSGGAQRLETRHQFRGWMFLTRTP